MRTEYIKERIDLRMSISMIIDNSNLNDDQKSEFHKLLGEYTDATTKIALSAAESKLNSLINLTK